MKLSEHIMALLKYKWDRLPLKDYHPISIDYQLHVLIINMILYHIFLIFEPDKI